MLINTVMRSLVSSLLLLSLSVTTFAGERSKIKITGIYGQWGYNLDMYSKSDIRFHDGNNYDFTIYGATATDKPDFSGLKSNPLQLTIPQFSYRVGLYLNEARTAAIEINFDHTKYVVRDNQSLRLAGRIHGEPIDRDTVISPDFIHFEHTNGANFYHINYVRRYAFLYNKKKDRNLLSVVGKAGAGIVLPKSDVTLMGVRRDNPFHVAGYIISAEAGVRYYPLKHWFLEVTGKSGFAHYTDVLTIGNGRANHHFFYGEAIATVGYELYFGKKKVQYKKP